MTRGARRGDTHPRVTTTFAMRAAPPPFLVRLLTAEAILGVLVAALPALLAFVGARSLRPRRFPRAALVLALFPAARAVAHLRRARDVVERVELGDGRCALRVRRRDAVIEREVAPSQMTVTWRRVPRDGGDLACLTLAAPGGLTVRQYARPGVWEEADLRALREGLASHGAHARERVGEGWFAA